MDGLKLAAPLVKGRVVSDTAPYLKVTEPVGVEPEPLAVAVIVIGWPTVAGLGFALKLTAGVALPAALTTRVANPDSCPPQVSA